VTLNKIVALFVHKIKRELIRENIDESVSQRKFIIKEEKRQNNFVKSVVHIYNGTLDDCTLSQNEFIQGK